MPDNLFFHAAARKLPALQLPYMPHPLLTFYLQSDKSPLIQKS